ncbi:MAG: radical SAM protein [Bacteroidaceae bacterium]|nr:radical SAM protein [Bacteroidaceae bacterium]
MSKAVINLFAVERTGTRNLGPGLRYAIWLQGCPFNCFNCITPQARPVVAAKIAEVESLAKDIVSNSRIDGLTISGGEPFLQAEALVSLLSMVREYRPELTVLIFTGFNLENLDSPMVRKVLEMTDVLIDGKYIDSLNDGIGLRGSSNQRIHFLSDRLTAYEEEMNKGKRSIEVSFHNKVIDIIGIPLKQKI